MRISRSEAGLAFSGNHIKRSYSSKYKAVQDVIHKICKQSDRADVIVSLAAVGYGAIIVVICRVHSETTTRERIPEGALVCTTEAVDVCLNPGVARV